MIIKLRKKFTAIFMTVTLLTLASVLIFIALSTQKTLMDNCYATLSEQVTSLNGIGPGNHNRYNAKLMVLKYNRNGQRIDSVNNHDFYNLTDEELNSIALYCLKTNERFGSIPNYAITYMKYENLQETRIAFYDFSSNEETLQALYTRLAIIMLVAVPFFFAISYLLARWCVRPIDETLKKQRDFIADASHELKTPLTVILANTSILKDHSKQPIYTKEKCITYIEDEANHMKRLVNDMLFLAKTDALKEEILLSDINISDMLMNCCLTFESVAYDRKINIETKIEENIVISGDEGKLSQLCNILMDNACKYTNTNGNINVSLQKKGNLCEIVFNNTGTPIAKDQLNNLFERFYRVDEARTRTNAGYGLGLSMAKRIVEMHNGKIWYTSSEEEGVTAHLNLNISM